MGFPSFQTVDEWKKSWTDRIVKVKPGARPELKRFEGKVGRVVTINYDGAALVDFADGAWYDILQFDQVLETVTDEAESKKYDSSMNGAQKRPERQS